MRTDTTRLATATAEAAGDPPAHPLRATCPLCHTADSILTEAALAAGGEWTCATCSAHWNTTRVAKVTAYRAWVREHRPVAHAVTGTG